VGVEVQLYPFFNLGAQWGWVDQCHTWPLYLWEGTPLTVMKLWKLNFSFTNYVFDLNSVVSMFSENVYTLTVLLQ
jgi:hypothetical protein